MFPDEVIESITIPYDYLVFQLEQGELGTPHYQGYIVFSSKQRLTALTAIFRTAHWEIARGTPTQNRTYCTKPDGRLGDFCEVGDFPETTPGRRTDLERLHSRLQDAPLQPSEYASEFFALFARYPDLPNRYFLAQRATPRKEEEGFRTWLLLGPPGLGKSRFSLHLARALGGGEPYRHGNTKWFDGYRGERTVILDDFCGSSLPFSTFKRLVDRYPFRVELKGSSCEMAATNFIITSNYDPEIWWKPEVTGPDRGAIFRRVGKVLWFRAENQFSVYPDYATYARIVLTPRPDGAPQVETQMEEVQYPQGEEAVFQKENLL